MRHLLVIASAKALSIGIDLGTSTSCCAVYRNGAPELVPRRVDGKLLTPSVCVVSCDSIRIDEPNTPLHENEVLVTSWKRAIGLDEATAAWRVEEPTKKRLRLDDGAKDPDNYVGVVTAVGRVKPVDLSSCVLDSLLDDCEAFLGERPKNAVIGVPACFLPSQRRATEAAAYKAGLQKVQIANEPELAARAHGTSQKNDERLAMVFDLGGGTLDVSLVDVGGRTAEVISTAGDLNLGGDDFTRAVIDVDPSLTVDQAERVKIELTTSKKTETVTRSDLEKASSILLERCCDAAREACVLGDARLEGDELTDEAPAASTRAKRRKQAKQSQRALDDLRKAAPNIKIVQQQGSRTVDDLVLVGAATKMPCVQKCLSKLTGVPYRKAVDPDRAVAFGAALQARANDGEIAAEDDFVVVGAFQAEVLRHFAQANSVDDEDLGALEDEDGDFEAYLEDLDEVDDEEFERLLALAEEGEEEEFVDIDGDEFDRMGL
jgi:molecular chaperone DnaK (HSP70)